MLPEPRQAFADGDQDGQPVGALSARREPVGQAAGQLGRGGPGGANSAKFLGFSRPQLGARWCPCSVTFVRVRWLRRHPPATWTAAFRRRRLPQEVVWLDL